MAKVAPRVGAWIETSIRKQVCRSYLSHPVWVRGLKPKPNKKVDTSEIVAPRVGAWIETIKNR